MDTISLNLSHEEFVLFNDFAKMKKMTIENLLKKTLLEKIEDEYNLMMAKEALFEFSMDSDTFTAKEMQ
ncbi:MAG: type II toxin-antitoxin system RelB family antitoxin [Veillonella sp.]